MSVSGLAVALVVPPANLVPLSLLGLALAARRPRLGLTLAAVGLGGLLLLSMPFFSDWLLVLVERGLPLEVASADPPQAIVILTADMAHTTNTPLLEPGPLGLERAWAGAELYHRVPLPILVTGGVSAQGGRRLPP